MSFLSLFSNPNTGLGDVNSDSTAGFFVNSPRNLEQHILNNAYHHWAIRRVVDYGPEKSFEKGGTLTLGGDIKNAQRIIDAVNYLVESNNKALIPSRSRLEVSRYFSYAQSEANRTGAAIVLMDIDDGLSIDQPVDASNIKEIKGLAVFNRFQVTPVWNDGYLSGKLDPDLYQIYAVNSINAVGYIHPSRVLPFYGLRTPLDDTNWVNDAWRGDSVIRPILDAVAMQDSSLRAVGDKLQRFAIPVLKIKNLVSLLRNDKNLLNSNGNTESYKKRIEERAKALQRGWSAFKVLVHDLEEESVDVVGINFGGVEANLKLIRDNLVATTGMPEFVMLGKHGSGLGQVEKGERSAVQGLVESCQRKMHGNLQTLLTYYFFSKSGITKGKLPESWNWEWYPLWQETREEKATTYLKEAQAIATLVEASIKNSTQFGDRTPLLTNKELRDSLFRGTEFGGLNIQLQESDPIASSSSNRSKDNITDPQPTSDSIEINWYNLAIALEYLPGQERHKRILPHGYGHIKNHQGEDNEDLGCYIERSLVFKLFALQATGTSESLFFPLYGIRQLTESGKFDECKVMIGFKSENEAREAYVSCMPVESFGGIEEISIEQIATIDKQSQYWLDAINHLSVSKY